MSCYFRFAFFLSASLFSLLTPGKAFGLHDFPGCDSRAKTQRISFVHVNDLHANYQLDPAGISPFARIQGYVDRVRSQNPYTLFTDGGDDHEKGAIAEWFSRGASTREAVDALDLDIRTLGNHDFAWSPEETLQHSRSSHTLVLASNIRYLGPSKDFGAQDFVIVPVGCLKVGFFSLVTTPYDERGPVHENYYPVFPTDLNFIRQARQHVKQYRDQVDLLVLVSHLGADMDMKLGKAVQGIDLILGGHSHHLTTHPMVFGQTLIIQAEYNARSIVRLDLVFDTTSHKRIQYEYTLFKVSSLTSPPSSKVEQRIEKILSSYAPQTNQTVGWVQQKHTDKEVAAIIALRIREALGTDAAYVELKRVFTGWDTGRLTLQGLFSTIPPEKERPGTSGSSSYYVAQIQGRDLSLLQQASRMSLKFCAVFPDQVETHRIYTIALQKREAHYPQFLGPHLNRLEKITFAGEAWEILYREAQKRSADCRYLDTDRQRMNCYLILLAQRYQRLFKKHLKQ